MIFHASRNSYGSENDRAARELDDDDAAEIGAEEEEGANRPRNTSCLQRTEAAGCAAGT